LILEQPALFSGDDFAAWPFAGLEPMSFDFIMADPPTRFELWSKKGEAKSAARHYGTMKTDEIKKLPVGLLASNDAVLFLWATWPMLRQSLEIMDAWGFRYVSGGAWDKQRMGPGYVVRTRCEPWLLGTTGSFDHSKGSQNFFSEARREHSRKPEAAYAWAERYIPAARRLDLFSRQVRPGWTAWGDEQGKFNDGGDDES
jgi:N6-adenosine-specific RNA methylase IME4